jgi:hypothetical protein
MVVVAVALAFGMTAAAAAQGPAAAPGPAPGISDECLNSVFNMSDCLTYVTAGSTTRHPDKACCPELAGLLESHPVCLCQLLAGGAESYGVSVDYKRALALPGICRLTAPPVSACAGTVIFPVSRWLCTAPEGTTSFTLVTSRVSRKKLLHASRWSPASVII